jgi:hypothetical protein
LDLPFLFGSQSALLFFLPSSWIKPKNKNKFAKLLSDNDLVRLDLAFRLQIIEPQGVLVKFLINKAQSRTIFPLVHGLH